MAELLKIQKTYIAVRQQVLNGRIPMVRWPSEVLDFTLAKMKKMAEEVPWHGLTIVIDDKGFAYLQSIRNDGEQDTEGDEEA